VSEPKPQGKLAAAIVIAAGMLMATLSGLCTVSVLMSSDEYGFATIAIVVGGACAAVGVWLAAEGVRSLGSGRKEPGSKP
jgi:hypothetical protein